MEVKIDTNKGKWFDVKKTRAVFDSMQMAAEDYGRKSDATGVAYNDFEKSDAFRGEAANATKNFIGKGMASMNIQIADKHKECIQNQKDILEGFSTMVDASPNAYIDYDVLEKINADFCGYAEMFRTIDQTVAIILSALNNEFGEEYGKFPEPDSGSVKAVFADFCGADGSMGFVKKCQKKFVDFDNELTEFISHNNTEAFAVDIGNKVTKAAGALNAPIAPQINTGVNTKYLRSQEMEWRDVGYNSIQFNPNFNPWQSYDPEMILLAYGYTKKQIDSMGTLKAYAIATLLVNKAFTNPSTVDGFGVYGADQSAPFYKLFTLSDGCPIDPDTEAGVDSIFSNPEAIDPYIIITNEYKYNIIKNMPMCRNMSKAQIYRELLFMRESGCSYMIPVNVIMEAYADKEEEFELRFGFPLRDYNGDFNFDCLQAYYFLEEGGMVYLNYPNGIDNYVFFKEGYYDWHPNEYREKYGTDLYADKEKQIYEPNCEQNCINEAKELINKGIFKVKFYDGGTVKSDIDRINHFLNNHNVLDVDIEELESNPTPERIKKALDSGAAVSLNIVNGTFEDSEGNKVEGFDGGHAVNAVDVAEDGRIVISSWGTRFFYNPNGKRKEGERIEDGLVIRYGKSDPVAATLKGKSGFATSPYYDPNWAMDLKQV